MTPERRAKAVAEEIFGGLPERLERKIARAIHEAVDAAVAPGRVADQPINQGITDVDILILSNPGRDIGRAITDAVRLVRRMGCEARFEFNGVEVGISPTDSVGDVAGRIADAREERRR